MARLILDEQTATWMIDVPFVKYMLLASASLIGLLIAADHMVKPTVSTAQMSSQAATYSSLELLRKMANHGEARPFASAAVAGPFLPMPDMPKQSVLAVGPAEDATAKVSAIAAPPAVLNAQARLPESDVGARQIRPAKKVASRKPQQLRAAYVENAPRGSFGFFGAHQTW